MLASSRITSYDSSAFFFFFDLDPLRSGHQLSGRLFAGTVTFLPITGLHTGFLDSCVTFRKAPLDEFCTLRIGCVARCGWHGWVPIMKCLSQDCSLWGQALCSPWKQMTLETTCTESSPACCFEDLKTSIQRLGARYLVFIFELRLRKFLGIWAGGELARGSCHGLPWWNYPVFSF